MFVQKQNAKKDERINLIIGEEQNVKENGKRNNSRLRRELGAQDMTRKTISKTKKKQPELCINFK